MSKPRYDVAAVRKALDEVVAERPTHRDERAFRKLTPRYMEHGQPCCLVGVVLHRLGISEGVLKGLDNEKSPFLHWGQSMTLRCSNHPLLTKFTSEALAFMCYLQDRNDAGWTWEKVRYKAYSADRTSMWGPKYHPWLTPETAIVECDAEGPQYGEGLSRRTPRCTLSKDHGGTEHRDENAGMSWKKD